jgi:hypothetical protein
MNQGAESHHCLYHRKRGKHAVPELDMDENLQVVCLSCHKHTGKALTFQNRLHFWEVQCRRYGHDHMVAWHNALPLTVKENAYK